MRKKKEKSKEKYLKFHQESLVYVFADQLHLMLCRYIYIKQPIRLKILFYFKFFHGDN